MNLLVAIGCFFSSIIAPCSVTLNETVHSSVGMSSTELIKKATYLSEEEKAMIWEINLVRTSPEAYVPFIEEVLHEIQADSVKLSAMTSETIRKTVTTVDGKEVINIDTTYNNYFNSRVTAIRELLSELEQTPSMVELVPNERLYMAAVKHGQRQAKHHYIDHMGEDGTWPLERMKKEATWIKDGNENIARGKGTARDIVVQLLIDSGVPSRGHRKNILNPNWEYVTCHNVNSLNSNGLKWWLQEFAY